MLICKEKLFLIYNINTLSALKYGDIFWATVKTLVFSKCTCNFLVFPLSFQPGDFVHTLGDAHVYVNHIEPLKVQVTLYSICFCDPAMGKLQCSSSSTNVRNK